MFVNTAKKTFLLFLLILFFSLNSTLPQEKRKVDKETAIRLGFILKGMTKKEVFKAQGYPATTFKHNVYDVWYYPALYNAITGAKKFLDEVSIFFKDNKVVKIKSGTYIPNFPQEL